MPATVPVRPKPVMLLILDGWGHREEVEDNALAQADLPNWHRLLATCPHTLVHTEGRHVGLPDGQMGNSEVGHMNLGAGRIVYQDLTRVDAAIEDGRDTPPRSAEASLVALQALCARLGNAHIATIGGRYYAMDRDKRWDRVRRGWDAIVEADGEHYQEDALSALQAAYARGENDEFVTPTILDDAQSMRDGDAVVFMNFRADRARQLTAAFVDPGFDGFVARRPALSRFVCLTEYDAKLPASLAFAPDDLRHTFGEIVADAGLTQLRIAETEKYAHVTFFFSGGREDLFAGEERILVPSPQVATYDLQPEMSCPELTDKLVAAIGSGRFDAIVCNIANPDMVGHSGILSAAIAAAQAVDIAIGRVATAVRDAGGALIITADHGNLEMMRDPATGQPHTAHTVGPVPLLYVGDRDVRLRSGGALRDVAPTLLELMHLQPPAEMSGQSLLLPA